MPTSDQRIPNSPLSGTESASVALREVEDQIEKAKQNLLAGLRSRFDSDAVFGRTYGHPRLKIESTLIFHWASTALPGPKKIEMSSSQGYDPNKMNEYQNADHFVESTTRELSVDNPNAVRAHAGLPVQIQEAKRPGPDQMIGDLVEHSIPVTGAPEISVKETDHSERVAKEKKIAPERRLRKKQ